MESKSNAERYKQRTDEIAEYIIDQMEQGLNNWKMPWHNGMKPAINQVTGKFFGGNNLMILWYECLRNNYSANRWATFKQWQKAGGKVRTFSKGTIVCYAIPQQRMISNSLNNEEEDDEGQLEFDFLLSKHRKSKKKYHFRYLHEFNVDQVDNYDLNHPDLFVPVKSNREQIDEFIRKTGARIKNGSRALYNKQADYIEIPHKIKFTAGTDSTAEENYYSTLLHELIHWTAHPYRCNRPFGERFGDKDYAFEELIAELGGAMLSTDFNQQVFPREDHARYLNDWLKVLKNDFSFFTEALDLARTAIFWLYKQTGLMSFDLKPQFERPVDEERVEKWVEYLD